MITVFYLLSQMNRAHILVHKIHLNPILQQGNHCYDRTNGVLELPHVAGEAVGAQQLDHHGVELRHRTGLGNEGAPTKVKANNGMYPIRSRNGGSSTVNTASR